MFDRVDIINNDHTRELALDYQCYYNQDRPHQGINGLIPGQSPEGKKPTDTESLKVKKTRKLNGLITKFELAA